MGEWGVMFSPPSSPSLPPTPSPLPDFVKKSNKISVKTSYSLDNQKGNRYC